MWVLWVAWYQIQLYVNCLCMNNLFFSQPGLSDNLKNCVGLPYNLGLRWWCCPQWCLCGWCSHIPLLLWGATLVGLMALLATPSALPSMLHWSSSESYGYKGLLCLWTGSPSLAGLPMHTSAPQAIPLLTNYSRLIRVSRLILEVLWTMRAKDRRCDTNVMSLPEIPWRIVCLYSSSVTDTPAAARSSLLQHRLSRNSQTSSPFTQCISRKDWWRLVCTYTLQARCSLDTISHCLWALQHLLKCNTMELGRHRDSK